MPCARAVPGALPALLHLSLLLTRETGAESDSSDNKNEAERLSDWPWVTEL